MNKGVLNVDDYVILEAKRGSRFGKFILVKEVNTDDKAIKLFSLYNKNVAGGYGHSDDSKLVGSAVFGGFANA